MTSTRRHLCLALLVALLVGHVGIAVHAATHVSGDAADCELCSSFSTPAHGAGDAQGPDIPDARYLVVPADREATPDAQPDAPYYSRGPPLLN